MLLTLDIKASIKPETIDSNSGQQKSVYMKTVQFNSILTHLIQLLTPYILSIPERLDARSLISVILLSSILSTAYIPFSMAETFEDKDWLENATKTIKDQEKQLKRAKPASTKVEELSALFKQVSPIKSQASNCIDSNESQLANVIEDLATLGEASTKEPSEVKSKRSSLGKQQKSIDKQLSSCRLLLLQSQDLIESINKLQQEVLAQQLSARTPNIFKVITENFKSPVAGMKDSANFVKSQYELKQLSVLQFFFMIVLAIAAVIGGIYLSTSSARQLAHEQQPRDSVSAFILATHTSLAKSLPIVLPIGIIAAFLSIALPLSPLPFITKASYIVGGYLGVIVLINILLNPAPPATIYLTKPDKLSIRLAGHLKMLATLGLFGSFILTGEFKAGLSEPVYYLSRSIFSILLIINLISTLWLVRLFSWAVMSRGPRIFLSVVLIASLIAELSGYRNLSSFVFGGVIASSFSLGLTMLVYRLLKDLCDGFDEGRLDWEATIRARAGLKKDMHVPGLVWVRIIIFIMLWGGFAVLALYIWKLDDPWLGIITSYLTDGFEIGSLKISPTLLIGGLFTFVLILNLTRYIKNNALPHALKYTSLDLGAREAVASLIGYTGVAIAILISLSITGVQMQNIAIIAGALSVGIGFGLQNIVNNFISGLILLFERPIRRGDWIVTGDTEGYVKAIKMRSTQIQTFDRAEVIVPNSELITAKVTNWMLRDSYGRISITVGVGYDSDVDLVHKTLHDIAKEHPMVIQQHATLSAPKVLFKNFGDSALDFELRCFIYDIDQRVNIISEINFSIIKAFRKEKIDIPFPQRVVTVSNWQDQQQNESPNA